MLHIDSLDPFKDDRGWVDEIYSGELGNELQNIHLGTMKSGVIRGNHRHPDSKEWIIFMNGKITIIYEEESELRHEEHETPVKVSIAEGIPHAFQNRDSETIHFVAYRNTLYEENPDTEEYNLIETNST